MKGERTMVLFSDKALVTAREEMQKLYAKLASTKPTDEWTRDDIRGLMTYLTLFDSECRHEQYRRAKEARKAR